jgi:hypothetical protein
MVTLNAAGVERKEENNSFKQVIDRHNLNYLNSILYVFFCELNAHIANSLEIN